jgi:hypothetical protein
MKRKIDKTNVNPLTGSEDDKPATPLETVPKGNPANATTATIPGTGKPVTDERGQERRILRT